MYKLAEQILFDAIDLNTVPGLRITGYDTFNPSNSILNNQILANSNKSNTVSRYDVSRRINIRGVIARNDRHLLEQSIDSLNSIIKKINKTLDVPLRDSRYEYRKVSYSNLLITDVAGGFCRFDVEFLASDPFSYSKTLSTVLANTNITSQPQSLLVNLDGNTSQTPIITITIIAASPASSKNITITNPITDEFIQIERVFTAGEIIKIDTNLQTVIETVSGSSVDYLGKMLNLEQNVESLRYSDSFTTRNVNIKIENYTRYA